MAYKVTKLRGAAQNVFLENTATAVSVNLGRISVSILNILAEDGIHIGPERDISMSDEWNIEVSAEAKDKLKRLAMPMKKPIRDQRKKKEETEDKPKATPKITADTDLFDLIYGSVE